MFKTYVQALLVCEGWRWVQWLEGVRALNMLPRFPETPLHWRSKELYEVPLSVARINCIRPQEPYNHAKSSRQATRQASLSFRLCGRHARPRAEAARRTLNLTWPQQPVWTPFSLTHIKRSSWGEGINHCIRGRESQRIVSSTEERKKKKHRTIYNYPQELPSMEVKANDHV